MREADGAAAILTAAVLDVQRHRDALAQALTLRAAPMLRASEHLTRRADATLPIAS